MHVNVEGLSFFSLGLGVMLFLALALYFHRWSAGKLGAAAEARAAAAKSSALARSAQLQAFTGRVSAVFFLLLFAALLALSLMRLLGATLPWESAAAGSVPTP